MNGLIAQKKYIIGGLILFLLIVGLVIGLYAVKKPQELRKKAAVPASQGSAIVAFAPQNPQFIIGQPATVALFSYIGASQVDGFQVVAYLAGEVPQDVSFQPKNYPGLTLVKSTIEDLPLPIGPVDPTTPKEKLTLAFITSDPQNQYVGIGTSQPLGSLTMTPTNSGSMFVTFDNTLSKITRSDKTAPLPNDQVKDILIFPQNSTLTFATPTPTNTPTSTPTPLPTPTFTPTPTPTPAVSFGPGELTDIIIIPSINSQGVITFSVSGPRVTNLTTLRGEYRYMTQSGSSNFSPNTTLVDVTFTKGQTEFIGSINPFKGGCMDLFSNTTYVASICLTKQANTGVIYGADARLPYKYIGGIYDWGYLRQQVFLSGTLNTQVSPVYFLSSTLAFDKNSTPYWKDAGNFVPTYYFWTDSVTSGTSSVSNLFPTMIDTPSLGCYNNEWVSLGIYSTKYLIPSSSYYGLNSVPFGNSPGPCIFYTYTGAQIPTFNELRNKYTTIVPFVGPTPTSTPTPTPRPTSTPTPTFTPTPTVTPTPIPTSITFLHPLLNENLQLGSQYTIQWNSQNVHTIYAIRLYNYPEGSGGTIVKSSVNIVTSIPNTNSYTWTVSTSGLTDPLSTDMYKLNIISDTTSALSDAFIIIFPTPTPTSTPTPTPTNTPTPTFTPTPTPSVPPTPTVTNTPTPISCQKEDINRDGFVDFDDYTLLLQNFFSTSPAQPRADINGDGIVDLTDYSLLVLKYGQYFACTPL